MSSRKHDSLSNITGKGFYTSRIFEGAVDEITKYFEAVEKKYSEGGEKERVRLALARVGSLLINCDKNGCISSAKALLKYLQHKSDIVRHLASREFCFFIKIASFTLVNENDPKKLKELSDGLLMIIDDVAELFNNDLIPKDIASKVHQTVKFAKLGLLGNEIGSNRIKFSREFVSSAIETSIKRLINNFSASKLDVLFGEESEIYRQE